MGPFGVSGVPAGGVCAWTGLICAFAFELSLWISASVGNVALPAVPDTIDGRYWKVLMKLSESFGDSGLGPLGLGPTPSPLAAIQISRSRCGVAPAKTGYEATGTRPISWNAFALRAFFRARGRSQP